MKVIVIGAGMAGLGAARLLQDAGVKVKVIEAKPHIGGRTFSSHLWPDLPVDLGASWVHGIDRNPLISLSEEAGVKPISAPYERWATYDATGNLVDVSAIEDRCEALIDAAREESETRGADVSIADAVTGFPAWAALPPADRAVMRMIIATRTEHEYNGDWTRLSAWGFDADEDFEGGDILLSPGYGPIVGHLAKGLDICLSEVVEAITPTEDGVTVRTQTGICHADHVIVTLPLGVLKSGDVRFDAPLAPKRQAAISRLGVGLLNKCWLRFDRVFWPATTDMLNFIGPTPLLWAEWLNGFRISGQPLLVGFNAGDMAEEIEAWDDRTTTASAMAALRGMFGSSVPDPIGSQITRWRQDPFAQGAYSFVAVGATSKDRLALAGPDWEGRLWFAGEATSPKTPATAHGALTSGRQAAAALLGRSFP